MDKMCVARVDDLNLPSWVPQAARYYIAHTEAGCPIRALARDADVHASTILRQVRRFETRRDDPLVDGALRHLAQTVAVKGPRMKEDDMTNVMPTEVAGLDDDRLTREGVSALQELAVPRTLLAVADGMDMAVIVRDLGDGDSQRVAAVSRDVAQALALRDLIACDSPDARISRYRITAAGRSELGGADGFAEAQASFAGPETESVGPVIADSPLAVLSRRRGPDGQPFLSRELVQAGERLREDFELSQMEPRMAQDWGRLLTGPGDRGGRSGGGDGVLAAKQRVAKAMYDLGPGLSDVALHCCCFLEGMEQTEKRMGWSARSGKVVLRIALERLRRHYAEGGSVMG